MTTTTKKKKKKKIDKYLMFCAHQSTATGRIRSAKQNVFLPQVNILIHNLIQEEEAGGGGEIAEEEEKEEWNKQTKIQHNRYQQHRQHPHPKISYGQNRTNISTINNNYLIYKQAFIIIIASFYVVTCSNTKVLINRDRQSSRTQTEWLH